MASEDLLSLKEILDQEVEAARSIYEEAKQKADAVGMTIRLLQERGLNGHKEIIALGAGSIDFTGAKNLRECCERIAQANGGILRAAEAAVMIIEAGHSQTKKKWNLVSSIYGALDSKPEEWSRVEPGVYRWKEYQEQGIFVPS